jgi:hypothetical protein
MCLHSFRDSRDMGIHRIAVALLLFLLPSTALADVTISVQVGPGGTTDYDCLESTDTCPAPKALFFDATATSCDADECGVEDSANNSFRALQYTWNFGDPGRGNWKAGAAALDAGHDKNIEYGPIAFHVYDRPDTYTVELEVTDGTNTWTWTDDIYIDDPDTYYANSATGRGTVCVAPTIIGDGSEAAWVAAGCPANSGHRVSPDIIRDGSGNIIDTGFSWHRVIEEELALFGTGSRCKDVTTDDRCRRILFRNGSDYYAASTVSLLSNTGPVQIATFGNQGSTNIGGDNRVDVSLPAGGRVLHGNNEVALEHYSVWNFDFAWPAASNTEDQGLIITNGDIYPPCWNDFLSYNNSATDTANFNGSKGCANSVNAAATSQDVFFVFDGQVVNGVGLANRRCNFYNGQRMVYAGAEFGSQCERDIRHDGPEGWGVSGPLIFAHNTHPTSRFILAASIDLRGATTKSLTPNITTSQYILISDSVFPTPNSNTVVITSCCGLPSTSGHITRTADVLIERNRATMTTGGFGWINNRMGRRVTVRNNLIAGDGDGVVYDRDNGCPNDCEEGWAKYNHVLNNSVYSADDVSPFYFNAAYADADSLCQNNVFYNTAGTSNKDACDSPTVESDNASLAAGDDVTITGNPFVSESAPTVTGPVSDWVLDDTANEGLAAQDRAGAQLQSVLQDFDFLAYCRPTADTYDIGALEKEAEMPCSPRVAGPGTPSVYTGTTLTGVTIQ